MNRVSIKEAAQVLRSGEIVAYPTETVYGLGIDPFSETAVERLFRVKSRDRANPVLLIVANEQQLRRVVSDISPDARACMDAFWPGPLSLLFPKASGLPPALTAGGENICVRCTSSSIARDLCLEFGGPITSSSANLSGQPPAVSLEGINLPGIAAAVDGGTLRPALPSTVFDPDARRIIRQGAVGEDELNALFRHK